MEQEPPAGQVEPVFAGGYTEATRKTLAAIQAGTPPDVAIMLSQNLNDIISQNIVIPLDELIAADAAQMKMDDFFPAFMLNSTSGGKVWSIPFQRSTPVMYYNKEAFKEVGLDPNKPPQTWTEMVAAAKKLTKQEGGRTTRWGLAIPSSGGVDTWLYEALTIAAGGLLYDANNSCCKGHARDKQAETAGPVPPRSRGEGEVSPPGAVNWGTTANDFSRGNVAMIYTRRAGSASSETTRSSSSATAFLAKDQRFGAPTGGGTSTSSRARPRTDRRRPGSSRSG
jgi:sn-glycerol 3-phosphate transport system substrate-binding protein